MRWLKACSFERSNRSAILAGIIVLGLLAKPGTSYSLIPVRDLWVPNGQVRTLAHAGNALYLGGDFSMVGPVAGPACAIDLVTAVAQTPNPHVIGSVSCMAPDGSGGWYIGGDFTWVQGQPRNNLAHIDPNGVVTPWNPPAKGGIYDIAVGGGVVYAVGNFPAAGTDSLNNQAAAFDAVTGAVTHWSPTHDNSVERVEVDGGKVYLAGNFTTMAGQPRRCLAEFTAVVPGDLSTGALTGTFSVPDPLTVVTALKVQGGMLFADNGNTFDDSLFVHDLRADTLMYIRRVTGSIRDFAFDQATGRLYVCGPFNNIAGMPRASLAAIYAPTGLVTPWSVSLPLQQVRSLALAHVNGVDELVLGGDFSTLGGKPRKGLGIVDPQLPDSVIGWTTACDGTVDVVRVDGTRLYVAGDFAIINGVPRSNLAAIDESSGTLLDWSPTTNGAVHALTVSGNTLYLGGEFTSVNGTTRNHAAGVDAGTGALTVFNPNTDNTVRALAVDGSTVYMGGDFAFVRGADHMSLAAVNAATGAPLASWAPYTDGVVNALLFVPGGVGSPILVAGGAFSVANGATRHNFVSLDAATGTNTSLDPGPNGPVSSLAFIPTPIGGFNQLYVGGDFTSIGGQPRNHIAMLIAFGAVASWDPNASAAVHSIVPVGNTVIVGGQFYFMGGSPHSGIAAIDDNGAATQWDPDAYGVITSGDVTALLEDAGIVYAGGTFTNISSTHHAHFAGLYDTITAVADEPASATPLAPRAAPNPFDESTKIQFSLPRAGVARVAIYDVTGRRVRELHNGWLSSGQHTMPWDGREDSGKPVAAGVYFLGVGTQAGTLGSKVYRLR